ncbi:uncharacterized protein MONOS_6630 [Monocercomonoides exilis]|uniref:uncharacterized protein n=1 Tax=Monocercomonoides exilis TaxID=2049356 RepID=UPI00355AAA88|nr:hypothetical protein MONOS_6630 [Monocercomonoides exilis]|eukprot:MONOS_6630.1-p1 / transcript=MONOS_6630.1 / gene=MONOS_6630 / organism=Monocercomonoides_exilis_PA203 / gene_product=unspecified product / transcript_product=unspecified product / location=Mono_scaffold00212:25283-26794(+) / protein_length=286 / sequence_SO=supercontig / SO=protein_coding / is_pseudo=false
MDDTDPLTTRDAKWIMVEFTETLSNTNLSSGVIHQTPRKGMRHKSMWDLTIITKWAEITQERKYPQILQRRALIHYIIFGAFRPAELENAVAALQRWMGYTKTTFREEHAPGSRGAQENYTVLPVQDTRWILETICGPVSLAEKGDKSEKNSERKDIINKNTEAETKEYPGETTQVEGEGDMSKRKKSKSRGPIRERSSHHESDFIEPPRGDETSPIIPRSIMELTEGRLTASQKKFETYRRKRGERSIGQIVSETGLLRDNRNTDGKTIGGVVRGGARRVWGDD